MAATDTPAPRRGGMAITVTALMIFFSATGTATPKSVAKVQAVLGLGLTEAQMLLHIAPVAFAALAVVIAQALAAKRGPGLRFGIYALLGLATGFVLGVCLDLFVGVGAMLAALFGPSDVKDEHAIGWAMTAVSFGWALMLGAIAVFGTPAARALQEHDGDPECAEVRPRDRTMSREGAVGMAALGASTGALTILSQTSAAGAPGAILAAVAVLGFIGSTWASWLIWRRADELQQRAILQAYAVSALLMTAGVFAWSIATGLGATITISPFALYLGFSLIQIITAMIAHVAAQITFAMPTRGRAA